VTVRPPLPDIEPWVVNSPLRAFVQRHYEVPALQRLGATIRGRRVLEIGCGRGIGVQLLLDRLGAASVAAIDVDAAAVARARRRLAGVSAPRLGLCVADATAIPVADQSVDAVFDFAVVHHIPDWRRAVAEVCRVLVPGGVFAFSEVTEPFLGTWPMRAFTDHPHLDRFTGRAFVAELERAGLAVADRVRHRWAFVLGVARKVGPV
jgi:ubiquinone/menaquinone biosynthesis C-methylase UbiE